MHIEFGDALPGWKVEYNGRIYIVLPMIEDYIGNYFNCLDVETMDYSLLDNDFIVKIYKKD